MMARLRRRRHSDNCVPRAGAADEATPCTAGATAERRKASRQPALEGIIKLLESIIDGIVAGRELQNENGGLGHGEVERVNSGRGC